MKPLLALAMMVTPAAACDAVVYTSQAAHESVVRSTCVMIGTAVTVIMLAGEAAGAAVIREHTATHKRHWRHRRRR